MLAAAEEVVAEHPVEGLHSGYHARGLDRDRGRGGALYHAAPGEGNLRLMKTQPPTGSDDLGLHPS